MQLPRRTIAFALTALLAGGAVAAPGDAPASLEARVARLERVLDSSTLVNMLDQLNQLQQQVQVLQGQLDKQGHQLQAIEARQRDMYMDLDKRLQPLEAAARARPATPPAPAGGGVPAPQMPVPATAPSPSTPPAVAPSTPVAAAPAQPEQKLYEQAFNLLKDGSYKQAIAAFQSQLKSYPSGSYADNAYYWTGESYYVMRDFPAALASFQKVLSAFPNSPKALGSMLKIGYIHYELKQWAAARQALEQLKSRAPGSREARLADARLQQMQREGH